MARDWPCRARLASQGEWKTLRLWADATLTYSILTLTNTTSDVSFAFRSLLLGFSAAVLSLSRSSPNRLIRPRPALVAFTAGDLPTAGGASLGPLSATVVSLESIARVVSMLVL